LHSYAGKNIFFIGVIFAGIVVSLLESVCTGQLYVPTLAFMARQADTKFTAFIMLLIYNSMFILPLFILAALVSIGVKGIMLANVSRKHVIPALIIQAILFLVVGIGMLLTI
jgi:cytochrome c biogenesis protein CcdA